MFGESAVQLARYSVTVLPGEPFGLLVLKKIRHVANVQETVPFGDALPTNGPNRKKILTTAMDTHVIWICL